MSEPKIYYSQNDETEKLGEEFAKVLKPGDIICLFGDLGAGKTTFTKGIARGLGITTRITSPTFVIIRKYNLKKTLIKTLYHIDLYRLKNEKEVEEVGLTELFKEKKAVVVIEWPQRARSLIPDKIWNINFEYKDVNERIITITHI